MPTGTKIRSRLNKAYDYIVVGAGSAGCVVASRLSEDPSQTVLLLEAGGDDLDFPDIAVPSQTPTLQKTVVDWDYKTIPQTCSSLGLINRESTWPRGKVLGGSSCLNYMAYMRSSPEDYNYWARLGCEGWSYTDVLPYFMKSENNTNDNMVKSGFHARGGPLTVSDVRFTPLVDAFVQAGQELGYRTADCNGGDPLGFMPLQGTVDNGMRMNTARAFLRPVMHRENLHIATYAHVTKINCSDGRAEGISCIRGKERLKINAHKEIVLSAGSVGSTQILLLSGIGPKSHLESLKIPLECDLPVGSFLQDHLEVWGMQFEVDHPFTLTPQRLESPDVIKQYEQNRTGLKACMVGMEGVALIRSQLQEPTNQMPDIEIELISTLFGANPDPPIKYGRGLRQDVWDAIFGGMDNKHGYTLMPVLCHPKSSGTIRLRSSDPMDYPILDPQYLSHPDDVSTLVEAIKICLRLGHSRPLQRYGSKFIERQLPDYDAGPAFTDHYWEYHVRSLAQTVYHHSGVCKMGPDGDHTAIVDPQLRVRGIANLRVADASIMPEIPAANINATCIMIGEKAADLIKNVTLAPIYSAKL